MRGRHLSEILYLVTGTALVLMGAPALGQPGNGKGGGGSAGSAYLSFAADRTEAAVGDTVTLSWASTNTRFCVASGDWGGKYGTSGYYVTPPLDGSKSYTLQCKSGGTAVTATVDVAVTAPALVSVADPVPSVSLSAGDSLVASGGSTTLSWTSQNADSCTAGGGWSGDVATSGTQGVGPVDADTTFTLTCTGPGGTAADSVAVNVAAEPTVSLTAADPVVSGGGSTELSWHSSDATDCSASGGWSGAKATSGTETVGPIDQATSYGLTCGGVGGTAVTLISVAVNGTVTLNWQAPTQNVDGTALTDLTGFRIYYGQVSGNYTDRLDVATAVSTSQSLTLPSGSYYFAMTALDADGNESAYSNEVEKTVN